MQLNVEAYSLEIMDSLAVHAGFKAAMLMVAAYVGTDLFIPEKMKPTHRIAQLIGFPAAQFLAQHFGSIELRIPLLSEYERVKKISLVVHLHKREHLSFPEIAQQLGVPASAVFALYQQGCIVAPTRRNFKSIRYEQRYDFQNVQTRKVGCSRLQIAGGCGVVGLKGAGSLPSFSPHGYAHPQQLGLFDDISDGLV